MLIGLLVAAVIFAWAIVGMQSLGLNLVLLEAIYKPLARWIMVSGNIVRLAVWILALSLTAISGFSDKGTVLNGLFANFVTMSITVIAIDELVLYRNRLQRKQEILEQLQSPVRDIAVEC